MEIAYLDTSALVKRYHKEEYSDVIDDIFEKISCINFGIDDQRAYFRFEKEG